MTAAAPPAPSGALPPTFSALLPGVKAPGGEPALLSLEVSRRWTSEVLGGLAPLVLGEQRALYCADGGNRFDPYAFSTYARRKGFDPAEILDRVHITRAFTIHQMEAVAGEMFPPLREVRPRPLIVVLGLDHLFLEQTVPLRERRQVFDRVLGHLKRLRSAGMTLLITHDPPAEKGEAPWWRPLVWRASDARAVVHQDSGGEYRLRGRGSPFLRGG